MIDMIIALKRALRWFHREALPVIYVLLLTMGLVALGAGVVYLGFTENLRAVVGTMTVAFVAFGCVTVGVGIYFSCLVVGQSHSWRKVQFALAFEENPNGPKCQVQEAVTQRLETISHRLSQAQKHLVDIRGDLHHDQKAEKVTLSEAKRYEDMYHRFVSLANEFKFQASHRVTRQ